MYADTKAKEKQSSRPRYEPDLFTKKEVSEYPWVFKSSDSSVYITNVGSTGSIIELKGFVRSESESRKDMYFYVVVPLSARNGKDIAGVGKCTCESTNYYGRQCKHMLHMRNVYRKNMDGIDKLIRK